MSVIVGPKLFRRPKKGIKKQATRVRIAEDGTVDKKKVKVYLYKRPPKGCSVPRQICIQCRKTVIRKQSKLYLGKRCASCLALSYQGEHEPLNRAVASPLSERLW